MTVYTSLIIVNTLTIVFESRWERAMRLSQWSDQCSTLTLANHFILWGTLLLYALSILFLGFVFPSFSLYGVFPELCRDSRFYLSVLVRSHLLTIHKLMPAVVSGNSTVTARNNQSVDKTKSNHEHYTTEKWIFNIYQYAWYHWRLFCGFTSVVILCILWCRGWLLWISADAFWENGQEQ